LLGVITGLTAEARLAKRLGAVLAAGNAPARAAEHLADQGATALLSFGLAGGLNPALLPGTILVPAFIVTGTDSFETDAAMNAWLQGGNGGTIFGGETAIATGAEKHALRARTGADAVDMESGAVAVVAKARGLRVAALRVICDPADGDLPPAALVAMDARGGIGILRVLASVLRRPAQIAALLRLSGQAAAARRALMVHTNGLKIPAL
jgi:adenosylhomocysteine nucleosidase